MSRLIIFGHDYTRGRKNSYLKHSLVSLKKDSPKKFKEHSLIFFEVHPESMKYDFYQIEKIIEKNEVKTILFADDTIYSYNILKYIDREVLKKVDITFYVFDNFISQIKGLLKIEQILKDLKVRFLTPSNTQFDLFEKILKGQNDIRFSPYPNHCEEVLLDWSLREESRLKYGFKEDDIVILCTGESSSAKQIKQVLTVFTKLCESNSRAFLILSNKLDYSSDWEKIQQENLDVYSSIRPAFRRRILNLGFLQEKQITGLMQMSDGLINLNTSMDCISDIYLSMAMNLGLPAILTSWGGNKDYRKLNQIELIQVEFKKGDFVFSTSHLDKLLSSMIPLEKTKRLKNSLRVKWSFYGDSRVKFLEALDREIITSYQGVKEETKKVLKKKNIPLKDIYSLFSELYQ